MPTKGRTPFGRERKDEGYLTERRRHQRKKENCRFKEFESKWKRDVEQGQKDKKFKQRAWGWGDLNISKGRRKECPHSEDNRDWMVIVYHVLITKGCYWFLGPEYTWKKSPFPEFFVLVEDLCYPSLLFTFLSGKTSCHEEKQPCFLHSENIMYKVPCEML